MTQESDLFYCAPLRARISARQCLANHVKALSLWTYGGPVAVGFLTPCLRCKTGRKVKAYLPGDQE